MLLHRAFQRAGGWCEPVRIEGCNLTPELALQRIYFTICVVEHGRPVIGCGLIYESPREIVRCEAAVIKVVPRMIFVLETEMFQGLFYVIGNYISG